MCGVVVQDGRWFVRLLYFCYTVHNEQVAGHHAFLNEHIKCLLRFVQSIGDDIDKRQKNHTNKHRLIVWKN